MKGTKKDEKYEKYETLDILVTDESTKNSALSGKFLMHNTLSPLSMHTEFEKTAKKRPLWKIEKAHLIEIDLNPFPGDLS